jgi:hypothetical protein
MRATLRPRVSAKFLLGGDSAGLRHADTDQATRDALGVTGTVPCEPAFRRTLQTLDADALDEAADG